MAMQTTTKKKKSRAFDFEQDKGSGGNVNNQPSSGSAFEDTLKELEANKVAEKSEIATAEQNTQKYLNNYLKNQGIYGGGMGASMSTGIVNQANQLRANAEQNFNNQVTQYKQEYNENMLNNIANNIQGMVDSGKTKETIQTYLDKLYANDKYISDSTKQFVNDYLENQSGAVSWGTERDKLIKDIAKAITQSTDASVNDSLKIYAGKFKNAQSQEEYENIYKEYQDYVNSLALGSQDISQATNFKRQELSSAKDLYNIAEPGIMVGATSGGKQDKYAQQIVDARNNNQLQDNIIIDVNFGNGTDFVLYRNGNFYKLGKSIPSEYKSLPLFSNNNIKDAITRE